MSFKRFDEATVEQCETLRAEFVDYADDLPARIITQFKLLEGDLGGFNVTRAEHSLQTASRAYRDGKDEEYVVAALLHDIGEPLGPYNHGAVGAAILQPFINEANHFMVLHHAVFQGYHYYDRMWGGGKQSRGRHADSPHFEHAKEFVDKYDMLSFDDEYDTLPLEFFIPMVERVMRK